MANLSSTLTTTDQLGNAVPITLRAMLAGDVAGSVLAQPGVANGLYATPISLLTCRNASGSAIVASSQASGNFLISVSLGTSLALVGEATESATSTDTAICEFVLPPWYVAGQDLTLTVNAKYAAASGTPGTCTVAAAAYLGAKAGTMGATLIATAAKALSTSAADYAFVITGASLVPGAYLVLSVTTAIQETGGVGTVTGSVLSLRIS